MGPTEADVSIILVSWNTRELLLAALASLPAAIGGLRADLWVVDNDSADGSVAAVRAQFPEATVIANRRNLGYAAASNQAIAASTGRYILLLNSDIRACHGAIERLAHLADRTPKAGAVGPMLLNVDRTFQASFADFPSFRSELLNASGLGRRLFGPGYPSYGPRQSQVVRPVPCLLGACMLLRRTALERVGPLDKGYFMFSEDIDLCLRLRGSGWQVWYLPDARIIHHGGQSTRQRRQEMIEALYRSKVRFFRKHYGVVPAALLRACFFLLLYIKWRLQAFDVAPPSEDALERKVRWRNLGSSIVP